MFKVGSGEESSTVETASGIYRSRWGIIPEGWQDEGQWTNCQLGHSLVFCCVLFCWSEFSNVISSSRKREIGVQNWSRECWPVLGKKSQGIITKYEIGILSRESREKFQI